MATNVKNIYDLTDKEIKGIDLAFKASRKTYPFIKGWELYHKEQTYTSLLFVTAIIDIQETAKYVKSDIIPYWEELSKTEPLHSYSIGGHFKNIPNEDDVRKLRDNIEEKVKQLYEKIPDDFAIYNQMEGFKPNDYFNFRVTLSIINYKFIYTDKGE